MSDVQTIPSNDVWALQRSFLLAAAFALLLWLIVTADLLLRTGADALWRLSSRTARPDRHPAGPPDPWFPVPSVREYPSR